MTQISGLGSKICPIFDDQNCSKLGTKKLTVFVKKINVFLVPKTELKIRFILVRKIELHIRARVIRVWVNTRQIHCLAGVIFSFPRHAHQVALKHVQSQDAIAYNFPASRLDQTQIRVRVV